MSLVDLYKKRCYLVDGKYKPNFWIPIEPEYREPALYCGDKCPEEWGVESVISRSFAINKFLEDDGAGYFVGQALIGGEKLPDHPIIKPLLKSNIKDEKFHQRGVDGICNLYCSSDDLSVAADFGDRWRDVGKCHHPLLPVAVLETGAFMSTLGFWRVFGGETISQVASSIAFDEQRHVKTNRSILAALGFDPTKTPTTLRKLTLETLNWVFDNLNVPKDITPGYGWTKLELLNSALELLETGSAKTLNNVAFFGDYFAHFESNAGYANVREVI